MPRLLVTGATGFIGRHLLAILPGSSWEVHALVRNPQASLSHLAESQRHFYDGQAERLNDIMRALKPDAVMHLAGRIPSTYENTRPEDLVQGNVAFGAQLLEAMCLNDVSTFINAGTYHQRHENQPYKPLDLYAATKEAFNAIVTYYRSSFPMRVVSLDIGHVYGPGETANKVVSAMIQTIVGGQSASFSPGLQWVPFIHVDDVARGLLAGLDFVWQQPLDTYFNFALAPRESYQLQTLAEKLAVLLEVSHQIEWGGRPYARHVFLSPWQPPQVCPHWQPQIDLDTGLRTMIEAFRNAQAF